MNVIVKRKQEHSRKPESAYKIIEQCSPGPYLELFARERVKGWMQWGDQVDSYERPTLQGLQLDFSKVPSRCTNSSSGESRK